MTIPSFLENHQSFWIDSTLPSTYPSLTENIEIDVAIVGAGIAGVTAAYLLKKAGKKVALIEAERIAKGASGHTTAKVTSLHQLKYATLIEEMGEEKARAYGESNQAAIEQIATIVESEGIDCDFERKDAYTFATSPDTLEKVRKEVEAAKSLGLPASFVSEVPLPFPVLGAVKFSNQAQFHPRKYLLALAAKIDGDGSYVFEQTRIETVDGESPCQVKTIDGLTIAATDVIIATNLPILDLGLFFAKSYPQRSYLIGAKIDADKAPTTGVFIGTGEKYRSIRTTPTDDGGTLLLIGGEGHKVGEADDTEERFARLANYAREHFGVETIDYYWSSQDFKSFDQIPYVGTLTPLHKHTYVATGFSLWGMSNGTLSAMILKDLILDQQNSWFKLYDATRATPFATKESIKNNLDVGTRWVGDRLKNLGQSPEDVKIGEGKLVTAGLKKVGAYKDETGELHQVSAVCPHLGCIMAWNAAEKSWDCPCHGSRFDTKGKILHGPAVKELKIED